MKKILKSFYTLIILFVSILGTSCNPGSEKLSRKDQVRATAQEYFATFADRTDWEKLCSFYREDLIFQDIMLQLKLDSLWKFKRFYKWDEEGERFKKLSPAQEHLSVYSLVTNDSTAVARGRVNPFYYDGELIDPEWGMEFIIWLYFDEKLKIKEQVDWMEYDPYTMESTIKRIRENGIEKIPDWLDLSGRKDES